jgi:hypothetical protein
MSKKSPPPLPTTTIDRRAERITDRASVEIRARDPASTAIAVVPSSSRASRVSQCAQFAPHRTAAVARPKSVHRSTNG